MSFFLDLTQKFPNTTSGNYRSRETKEKKSKQQKQETQNGVCFEWTNIMAERFPNVQIKLQEW